MKEVDPKLCASTLVTGPGAYIMSNLLLFTADTLVSM